jgi:tryptophan synthase alpha chain
MGAGGKAKLLDDALARIASDGRVGLMTHIVYGYPSIDESRQIAEAMLESGVDLLEVQLPFSDPTADGPTITAACQTALDNGARVQDGIDFVGDLSAKFDVPLLFMSYFNIVFNYRAPGSDERGPAQFAAAAANAGAAGLIVPDIPPEESQERFPEACRENDLHPIYVTSPNVSDSRLAAIKSVASGFVYCTSRTGTTGRVVDIELDMLGKFLDRARASCGLPLAVGFSISQRSQVKSLHPKAEVAVVGSHLIRVYESEGLDGVRQAIGSLLGR